MKILFAAATLACAATSALAQPAPAVEYTLTVTPQDIGTIGQALGELPYKTSAQLIGKLNGQIAQQDADRAKAAEEAKKPAVETKPDP